MAEQVVITSRTSELEAEIRRVSLLFADIRGSTELVQHLDPEAAANMLGPPIEAMIQEVERFEGVASDRGDGIMAVFGAPSASEDHAIRACLAALAIQERLSSGPTSAVQVRVGIHFGEVVFRRGRIGKLHMQDVFGAAAHIAARLEQTTDPGTVCLSRAAYELAKGFVTAAPLPPIQVKGLTEPIERLLLLGADQTANRWDVQAGKGLAEFTGRTKELAALRRALGGPGIGARLIQIIGPAGIGKSRLVHEFLATEEARRCHVVKFTGDPRRQTAAYSPVSMWLRGLIDIRSSDKAAEARGKLARLMQQLEPAGAEDLDRIERMLGLGERARSDLADLNALKLLEIGSLIAAIIRRASAGRPLILACEDVDYFDPPSLELIPSLVEALRDAKVLVVTTGRSRSRLQSMNISLTRSLTLSALSDDDAKRMLANLHPDFRRGSALTATILRKAGGNPLFLEEVTSLIVPSGPARERARSSGPIGADAGASIPDRVEALIADRLGRLPKQQRRLVQACAVIGTDVPLRIAAKLMESSEDALHPRLAKLQSEQLLYETRKYPDLQFSFKHAITRDVAYNTILPSKRREYHAKIVEILEAEAAQSHDHHLDDLCMHAVHAQVWPKAVAYLRLAAATAVERSSYELAEVYLNRALQISETLPEDPDALRARIEILLGLRVLVAASSKFQEAGHVLNQADALARQLGDIELQSRIMVLRVHVLTVLGDGQAAIELAERSRERGRTLGDARLLMLATYFLGQAHFNLGNLAAADQALSHNAELLAETPFTGPTGTLGTLPVLTYGTRALTRAVWGKFADAARDVAQAKTLARESQRPYDLSWAAFADGFLLLQQRDGDAAVHAFRRSLSLGESREMTDPHLLPPLLRAAGPDELRQFENSRAALPHCETGLGHALLLTSDLDGALHWLSQAHETARKTNRYMSQVWAGIGLAHAHFAAGQADVGRRFAHDAAELANRFGIQGFRIAALRARGLIAGDAEDLRAALALAQALGVRAEAAHCHAALIVANLGDVDQYLTEARELHDELGMTAWFEHVVNMTKSKRKVYC